jgi:hypothetical protein
MNITRAIRQLRRSVGIEGPSIADYVAPAFGILAVGLIAGAGIALLLAPMPGDKMRERIGEKLTNYRTRFMLDEGATSAEKSEPYGARVNSRQAEPFPRS